MREKLQTKEKALLSAVVYFDIFEYPLTAFEAWQWSWFEERGEQLFLSEAWDALEALQKKEYLESREGFFYLKSRDNILSRRSERLLFAERKYAKARRYAGIFRWMPGVRMVAVCNNLAVSNARDESDIDFFIVTAPCMVWVTRFFCVAVAKFFYARPRAKKMKDTICLSFFAAEDALDLRSVQTELPDVYLAYWIRALVPLYDEGGYYDRFGKANDWTDVFLPNALPREPIRRRTVTIPFLPLKRMLEWLCSHPFFSSWVKRYQMRVLPPTLAEKAKRKDTSVVLKDSMLKFHSEDRRALYAQKFRKRREQFL